jgi:hypothetical protein
MKKQGRILQICCFPKVNIRKRSKKLTKRLVFTHPKMAFYFWTKPFGACKKKEKQHQIKEVYLAPYKTRQNPENVYVFPKVNNRKRHESFKNHNFLCAQKILENQ